MSKELKSFLKFSILMMFGMMFSAALIITIILDFIVGTKILSFVFITKFIITSILTYFVAKNYKTFKDIKEEHIKELVQLNEKK